MTASFIAEALLSITERNGVQYITKPWGMEAVIDGGDVLIKYIRVNADERTSLQVHEEKEEVIFPIQGEGRLEVAGHDTWGLVTRIRPGVPHRVIGPLEFLEISTHHPNDVIRLEDDYSR